MWVGTELVENRSIRDRLGPRVRVCAVIAHCMYLWNSVDMCCSHRLAYSLQRVAHPSAVSRVGSMSARRCNLREMLQGDMWHQINLAQSLEVIYQGELWPHEIVLMLHRRGLTLNRMVLVRLTLAKVMAPALATKVTRYLIHEPFHLSSDYLTRTNVPIGGVFLTLRRWFWSYGRLPVPRCLRKLVSVHPCHLQVVKMEDAEPSPATPIVAAKSSRKRRYKP